VSKSAGRAVVELAYPEPVVNEDLTYRPPRASAGVIRFRVNDEQKVVRVRRGGRFVIRGRAADEVRVPKGAASDQFGNSNSNALGFSL
jgi:hypothetical protein